MGYQMNFKTVREMYEHHGDHWSSGNLAYTKKEVASLLNYCSSLAQQKDDTDQNEFIQDRINELEILKRILQAEEKLFYAKFGVENIQQLQDKIDKIDKFLGTAFINGDEIYKKIIKEAGGKSIRDLEKPAVLFFKNKDVRNFLTKKFGKKVAELSAAELLSGLNSIQQDSKMGIQIETQAKDKKISSTAFLNSKTRGLQSFLGEIIYNQDDNQTKKGMGITVKLSNVLPAYYTKKLEELYGIEIQYAEGELEQTIRRIILNSVKDEYKAYVEQEIVNNISKYDLYSNPASISGFLGEVRNNVILNILYNEAHQNSGFISEATGNIKANGRSISIDSLFEEWGFQVKNYSIISGSVGFGNYRENNEAMSMTNFIDNRMRVDSLAEALYSLYGAYQYNQTISWAENFSGYRNSIENLAETKIIPLIESYADNIIKVTDEFQANNKDFKNQAIYYNTFFVVGKDYIPSSEIIDSLIISLEDSKAEQLVFLEQFIPQVSSSPVYMQPSNLIEAVNAVKVKYKITLRITEIITRALSKIKKN